MEVSDHCKLSTEGVQACEVSERGGLPEVEVFTKSHQFKLLQSCRDRGQELQVCCVAAESPEGRQLRERLSQLVIRWTAGEFLKLCQPAQRGKISPPDATREDPEVDRHQACREVKVISRRPACRCWMGLVGLLQHGRPVASNDESHTHAATRTSAVASVHMRAKRAPLRN